LEETIARHLNPLLRTAAAILKNKQDAEDAVQEAFIKWFEKKPHFISPQHETAWLMRVTINLCKSRLRSPWRKRRTPLLESLPAENNNQHEIVNAVLALPTKYRTVIHLFYFEGYSTAEIAEITTQKETTVRQQLTRARKMLKDEFWEGE